MPGGVLALMASLPRDHEPGSTFLYNSGDTYLLGAALTAAVGKPLIFTELGYENATDAASQPAGSSTNVVDSSLQAKLYEAFFEAWQQAGNSSLTGVYFWNWDPNASEVGPGNGVNFSPQGLPARAVAADWFGPGPELAIASAGVLTRGGRGGSGSGSGSSSGASSDGSTAGAGLGR